MRKRKKTIVKQVVVTDYAAEGKALARWDGKVVFIEGAVPGDVVDLVVTRNKKDWAEARVTGFSKFSTERIQPFCAHFGICGGCKWQMLPYEKQLIYKEREVSENLKRIGKINLPPISPIVGATETRYYRNKLEFTFSNREYLPVLPAFEKEEIEQEAWGALGFHAPRIFDKVIDIRECHLQAEPSNQIRNHIRAFAKSRGHTCYDIRNHQGWLRNLIIRTTTTGEIMVNICLGHEAKEDRIKLLDDLLAHFPNITTLLYTINPKWNDSLNNLVPAVYKGPGYIIEKLGNFRFKIGPKSFFQTNSRQAARLYEITREFAELKGGETLYDLYCGTGTIGIFMSHLAGRIIGVEAIDEAVADARENAALNGVDHASFFNGDVSEVCTAAFFEMHGKPEVIITDPPRAGMHEKLLEKILEMKASTLVYVSCNTATQARDLNMLDPQYSVERIQPVDMFPHTHHIENIVQLRLRNL